MDELTKLTDGTLACRIWKNGLHALCRYFLNRRIRSTIAGTALAISFLGCSSERTPSVEDFERAYSSVRIIHEPSKKITVGNPGSEFVTRSNPKVRLKDKFNQELVLEFAVRGGGPKIPSDYQIRSNYCPLDHLKAGRKNSEHGRVRAERQPGSIPMPIVIGRYVHFDGEIDPDLIQAVNTLVDWSIAAVETETSEFERTISGTQSVSRFGLDSDYYIFACSMEKAEFDLFHQAVYNTFTQSRVAITSYYRAHLWKYFFDNFDKFDGFGRKYLEAEKSIFKAKQAQAETEERNLQDAARIQAEGEARRAEAIEQNFPRPN